MRPFWRRGPVGRHSAGSSRQLAGRHTLGGAVSSAVALPVVPRPVLSTTVLPASAAPARMPAAEPRVELGFRDGSSTRLDPGSESARALEQLAKSLLA